MEERTVNIMLNATAELNRKEKEDLYIPVRTSEYRNLVRGYHAMKAQVEIANHKATNYGAESFRKGERIKELETLVADLRQKLAEVKEAAE